SISAAYSPTQRGYRTSNHRALDSVSVGDGTEPAPSQESCARRSPGDSNAHSGPLAATRTEAHAFQRNREAGSDMLLVRHIPGNDIPRKTGSKRDWQPESRKSPKSEYSNPVEDAKLRARVADKGRRPAPPPFLSDNCTCKAACRHGKVRRRC